MAKIVEFSKKQVSVNINFRRDMITAASLLKTWQVGDYKEEIKAVRTAYAQAKTDEAIEQLNRKLYTLLGQLKLSVLDWLKGFESGATAIVIHSYYSAIEEYMRVLTAGNKYNLLGSPEEMVRSILIRRAKKQLVRVSNSMDKLEKYQFQQFSITDAYLEGVDIQNETLLYDDQLILQDQFNFYSSYANEQEYATLLEALDVIAYFRGRPCIAKTASAGHDEVPLNRHTHFHLIDLLSLHEPAVTEQRSPFYVTSLVLPYFKETEAMYSPLIYSTQITHPQILRLYHQALQEMDPTRHYQALCKVYDYALACEELLVDRTKGKGQLLHYFYQEALEAELTPIYYLDSGLEYDPEKNEFHMVREQSYKDVLQELKTLSQTLVSNWQEYENKALSKLFQALAEAQFYELSEQAKDQHFGHCLEVENIFMELVACYLVERLNPQLKELIHTDKELVCPRV